METLPLLLRVVGCLPRQQAYEVAEISGGRRQTSPDGGNRGSVARRNGLHGIYGDLKYVWWAGFG